MLAKIRNYFRDYAAVLYSFGKEESSHLFPGFVVIGWRDSYGFNPVIMWQVLQHSAPDRHLLPHGIRLLSGRIGRAPRFNDAV